LWIRGEVKRQEERTLAYALSGPEREARGNRGALKEKKTMKGAFGKKTKGKLIQQTEPTGGGDDWGGYKMTACSAGKRLKLTAS